MSSKHISKNNWIFSINTKQDIFFGKSSSSNFTRENMSWCSLSQYITLLVPKTMTLSSHSQLSFWLQSKKDSCNSFGGKDVKSLWAELLHSVPLKYYQICFAIETVNFWPGVVKLSCVLEIVVSLFFNFLNGTPCGYTDNFPCLCHSFTSIPFKRIAKMIHPAENRLFFYLFHLNRFSLIFQASLILHSWKS